MFEWKQLMCDESTTLIKKMAFGLLPLLNTIAMGVLIKAEYVWVHCSLQGTIS